MATLVFAPTGQSTLESLRIWTFDFNPDLPVGVVVASVTATHTPPSGGTVLIPTAGTQIAGVVPVGLGKVDIVGLHYLDCVALLSDGENSSIRLVIPVDY